MVLHVRFCGGIKYLRLSMSVFCTIREQRKQQKADIGTQTSRIRWKADSWEAKLDSPGSANCGHVSPLVRSVGEFGSIEE